MRLFGRNKRDEPEEDRCPHCRERVPAEADGCAMCGLDLRPLRPAARARPSGER